MSDEKGHGRPGGPCEATKTLIEVAVEDSPGLGYEIDRDLIEDHGVE